MWEQGRRKDECHWKNKTRSRRAFDRRCNIQNLAHSRIRARPVQHFSSEPGLGTEKSGSRPENRRIRAGSAGLAGAVFDVLGRADAGSPEDPGRSWHETHRGEAAHSAGPRGKASCARPDPATWRHERSFYEALGCVRPTARRSPSVVGRPRCNGRPRESGGGSTRAQNERAQRKTGLASPSPTPSILGGAEGSRTPDLVNAIHALSQLSYSPGKPRETIPGSWGCQSAVRRDPPGVPGLFAGAGMVSSPAAGRSGGTGIRRGLKIPRP